MNKKRVNVLFSYNEQAKKWEAFVHGATDQEEAVDAFRSVVATCHTVQVELQDKAYAKPVGFAPFGDYYYIVPARTAV